jgi:hypothetical protein
LYGVTDTEEASKIARYIIKTLLGNGCTLHVGTHAITGSSDLGIVQVVLRLYKSIAEILGGFDISSCPIAFDGKRIIFIEKSRFTATTGYIIVDTRRRSTTFEARLIKYFKRGFGFILPYFDINKIKNERIYLHGIELILAKSGLVTQENCLDGFKIFVHHLDAAPDAKYSIGGSDYTSQLLDDDDDLIQRKFSYINAKLIAQAKLVEKDGKKVYQLPPDSNLSWYVSSADLDRELEIPIDIIWSRLTHAYRYMMDLDIRNLCQYTRLGDRMKHFRWNYLSLDAKEVSVGLAGDVKEFVISAYRRQADIAKQIIDAYPKDKLFWNSVDPQTQKLYGSFNPVIENPKYWYLNYYTTKPEPRDPKVKISPISLYTHNRDVIPDEDETRPTAIVSVEMIEDPDEYYEETRKRNDFEDQSEDESCGEAPVKLKKQKTDV